jgi:hypothetical protein
MAFFIGNGLVAGMILAAFFALCDGLFQTKTFPALIDVGYVPGLQGLHPLVELVIHLVISIFVTAVFYFLYPRYPGPDLVRYLLIWMGVYTALYWPVFWFSKQPMSFAAYLIWEIGHFLYSLFLIAQMEKNR